MMLSRRLFIAIVLCFAVSPAFAQGPPLSRIAFGSCARQDQPQPIWEAVVAARPELFLFIGDNIYGDTEDMKVMKAKYDLLGAQPGYQKLRKTCPVLATWDDHDYGKNDAGLEYPMKKESQQLFLDFFGVDKNSPRRQQEGVYYSQIFGPPDKSVQIILLDTRYFRSPLKKKPKTFQGEGPYLSNADPKGTVLGPAQWQWLEDQLRQPAKIRLLASSIQVVPEDHNWEKWMNHPAERERLFKLIRDTKAGGIVALSGDRHLAELSMMDAGIGYPLYDLTSSGLNQGSPKWRKLEVNRHRVATMNHGDNFGLITVNWSLPEPLVSLQIRDEAGDVTIQQKLSLSLLQPGLLKGKGESVARLSTGELLTPKEVPNHLNKKVTVDMVVQATGMSSTLVFLNSSSNFSSEENLTIVLDKEAQAKFGKTGIALPRTHFEGKTIRVTGTLTLFRERPQIIVSDPAQIEIVKK